LGTSQRGIDFLERWKLRYINPTPRQDIRKEAERLSRCCLVQARAVGISEEEIKAELTEDLVSHLAEELSVATEG
jgi:hypothetical protein